LLDSPYAVQEIAREAAQEAIEEGIDAIMDRLEEFAARDPRQLCTAVELVSGSPSLDFEEIQSLVENCDRNGLLACGAVVRRRDQLLIDRHNFYGWLEGNPTA